MEYLLKSTAILTLFYVIYKLFLQNETFFKSIRGYFFTGIISAIVLPFITITKYIQVNPLNIPLGIINSETSTAIQEQPFNWIQLLTIIYLLGVVVFTLHFLAQLSSLIWFLYTHSRSKKGKYILVKTTKNIAPFSFFNYIAYNNDQFKSNELEQILTHEKVHVNQYHSIDILLSQFIVIANWYNPLVWLYKKEVQKNLEFTADEFAQKTSQEEKEYQYLLLKTTSLNYKMSLTTNFYNSLIKKRIDMLQKNRSNKTMYLKFIVIIPILIAFVFTFNTKIIAQEKNTTESDSINITENVFEVVITKDVKKNELDELKEYFKEMDTQLKFKKVSRNNKDEITSISIKIKNKFGKESEISQKGGKPITPILITLNLITGDFFVTTQPERKIIISKPINSLTTTIRYQITGDTIIRGLQLSPKTYLNQLNGVVGYSSPNHNYNIISVIESPMNDSIKTDNAYHSNKKTIITRKVSTEEEPLIIVNGKVILYENLEDINSDHIKSINVLKGEKSIELYGDKGENGVIIITTKKNRKVERDTLTSSEIKVIDYYKNIIISGSSNKKPLIILDGKEMKNKQIDDITPDTIESITVLKGKKAIKKYGEKGKHGAIEVTTKK